MIAPHKKLRAWQTAHEIVLLVRSVSETSWRPSLGAVFNQLQRSALSVQLNIAEGYALGAGRRCRSQLEVAYGSAVETQELLEILADTGVLSKDQADQALQTVDECQKTLVGLIRRYQRSHK